MMSMIMITDTLTEYVEKIREMDMEAMGNVVLDDFIVTEEPNVPIESGSLAASPRKYSSVRSTGYRVNIQIVYSGDAPYDYRKSRGWKDFLPDKDYARFQEEDTRNAGWFSEGYDYYVSCELSEMIRSYCMKFMESVVK